jgi:hypothetical protein
VYPFGDAAYPGSAEGLYAFVRNADGRVTLFRVNGLATRARGISDSGVVTGFLGDSGTFKGFVMKLQGSPGYQAVSLPDGSLLASPLGSDTLALGIANNGVISGAAYDAAGNEHGFIATP